MGQLLKANSQWQSFLCHNVYKNLFFVEMSGYGFPLNVALEKVLKALCVRKMKLFCST